MSNFVRVYEGNSTDSENQKATFCGHLKKNLPIVQSTSNMMSILFHTSSYGEIDQSFRAAVSIRSSINR